MALILSGSAEIPLSEITYPRNFTSDNANLHFSSFNVIPPFLSFLHTCFSNAKCPSQCRPVTNMSYVYIYILQICLQALDLAHGLMP